MVRNKRTGIGVLALGAFVGASCSSGGGSSPPIRIGFESDASSTSEGATAQIVAILTTKDGPLLEDLTFTVQDAGTGSGTAGTDHDFSAARTYTFPSGSDTGATLTVDVALVADQAVEGDDETLDLDLADLPEDVGFGSHRSHALTLVETDFAEVAFADASSTTVDETTAHTLDIELELDPGESLAVDVQVTVADAGSGSATSGVDYMSFADQTIVFASGSANGARSTITLEPLGDSEIEGNETAELSLTIGSGVQLKGSATHVVNITDDDLAGAAMLLLDGNLNGNGNTPVADNDNFDLGSETLNSGPNEALRLTIQNAGAQPFDVQPLLLTGDTRDFSIDLEDGSLLMPAPVKAVSFPFDVEPADPSLGSRLSLSAARITELQDAQRLWMDRVALPGGGEIELELERLELPFTKDAIVRVDGETVPLRDVLGDLSLWRGSVPGIPNSSAFVSFSSEGSSGWVDLGPGLGKLHLTTVRPVAGSASADDAPQQRWVWDSQVEAARTSAPPEFCQGSLYAPGTAALPVPDPESASTVVGLTLPDARLAIETDFQFYELFNDTTAATQYVTGLIAAVSEAYERDVQTSLSIAYLGIHSTSNDGWSAQDTGGDAGDVLTEFRNAWGGDFPVAADLAHFISGENLGGGIAYLSVLCNQSFGFGVSGNINGNINWGLFTGASSFLNWDFIVVAHELGHNFGSDHTHEFCPPLDDCFTNCDGTSNCPRGTIMSYCHTCGGTGNIDLQFHPHVASVMRSNVFTSCLGEATLDPGSTVELTVSFEPTSTAGGKAAQLTFSHTAPNTGSPIQMNLSGTATN